MRNKHSHTSFFLNLTLIKKKSKKKKKMMSFSLYILKIKQDSAFLWRSQVSKKFIKFKEKCKQLVSRNFW
jgi:hypothetical protein